MSETGLVIGIEASNLRGGGGRTHLVEVLRAADPARHGIGKVIVWGSADTLSALDERAWLEKSPQPMLARGPLHRAFWQRWVLPRLLKEARCDALFVPGGNHASSFSPTVVMCRNMLPFTLSELFRYGASLTTLRLLVLRLLQSRSFRKAQGVIFLTAFAKKAVQEVTGPLAGNVTVVPHGLAKRFFIAPRPQRSIESYQNDAPYRIAYVSIVDVYKHQWNIVDAVAQLRQRTGWPLALDLAGPSYRPALRKLNERLDIHDPGRAWVRYHGALPYGDIHRLNGEADMGLFASTCENMPNILLETMAAGAPVACSKSEPMPEILGRAGLYFDAEQPQSIAEAIYRLIASPVLRTELSEKSYRIAQGFSWEVCADNTFRFIASLTTTKKPHASEQEAAFPTSTERLSVKQNPSELWKVVT